ncbi:NUDIX hydrolase [Kitasatospora sp. NPDC049258]|uniref:NUDIX hydrolase n=1 Tax=Kitasatospora sp. NPDC049258 TaxID=3155394 RepID=UPI003412A74D
MIDETVPPDRFAAALPRHVVSAGVLLTDPDGRVLMLRQARPYPGHPVWWQIPGGLADHGEQPCRTAVRETEEETGLRLRGPLQLLAVDYRRAADGWPPVIDFCFDGGTTAQHPVLSPEHDAYDWRSPRDWHGGLQPVQRRWFAALWQARRDGRPRYLTDGVAH